MKTDVLYNDDSIVRLKELPENSVHLIASDIPYGIGVDDWDVIHDNTNSAYMGASPAQQRAGKVFARRGKPLNGWSEADRQIPRQYYDWCMTWAGSWFSVLVPGGNAFVFAGRRLAHRCISAMEDTGFIFKDMIAWDKVVAPYRAQHLSLIYERRQNLLASEQWEGWRVGNLRPLFEPILWFMKPYRIGGTLADNVLQYGTGAYHEQALLDYGQGSNNIIHLQAHANDSGLHPTQKPLKLMKLLIELASVPGQVVLDPFCGSGTTLVAAMQLNRRYVGFESNQDYYQIANDRLDRERQRQRQGKLLFAANE